MDNTKIGNLIYKLRKENDLTQAQLAERLTVSDKAVSKWERGNGCPDISIITEMSELFGVDLAELLNGELNSNGELSGNIKNMKLYVCPECSNLITALTETSVSCCGKKLKALTAKKAEDNEKLTVEIIENEYFISSFHEMTKEHFISFVALLTGDSIILKKQYPEWELQTRIPVHSHGTLLWYCNKHGLFYQYI